MAFADTLEVPNEMRAGSDPSTSESSDYKDDSDTTAAHPVEESQTFADESASDKRSKTSSEKKTVSEIPRRSGCTEHGDVEVSGGGAGSGGVAARRTETEGKRGGRERGEEEGVGGARTSARGDVAVAEEG